MQGGDMTGSSVGEKARSATGPSEEADRLQAVKRYGILDTPPDGAFDRVTALAARLIGTPIAIISIVDTDRIWFKSHHGLDAEQVGRDPGLCASAILQDEPWVIENAAVDVRSLANPLVAGEHGFRSYAGVPLRTRDGYNLGTLCVLDRSVRTFSDAQVAVLDSLAELVVQELEVRLAARRAVAAIAEQLDHAIDREPAGTVALTTLTDREREVLAHLAEGLTNREIAARLFITEATVKSHVSSIFGKLELRNRSQAAVYGAGRDARVRDSATFRES